MDKDTQTQLGNALLRTLIDLKQKKGSLRIEDMGEILGKLAEAIQVRTPPEQFLRGEFESIAGSIGQARDEILSLIPQDEEGKPHITDAHEQLDAVVKMTDEASTQIMDSADAIQNAVDNNSPDMASIVSDAVAQIYLACNFQDITGQRITKVVHTLEFIDTKIQKILQLFSEMESTSDGSADAKTKTGDASAVDAKRKDEVDAGLLSGPALPDSAPNQADIDALFDSL